jgi:hypothetical protein
MVVMTSGSNVEKGTITHGVGQKPLDRDFEGAGEHSKNAAKAPDTQRVTGEAG